MNEELAKRLEDLDKENVILLIFGIIVVLSYVANEIEREYFITENDETRLTYYYLQSFIFVVVTIISIYFVYNTYQVVTNLDSQKSEKSREYAYLDFVASVIAMVASLILLYIAVTDTNLESEISI